MSHILIVANQTLGGHQLSETIRKRHGKGACVFTIVVPAVPPGSRRPTANILDGCSGRPAHRPNAAGNDAAVAASPSGATPPKSAR